MPGYPGFHRLYAAPCRVTVGDYPDLKDFDIVVNASGDILSLARSHDRVKEMEFTVPAAEGFPAEGEGIRLQRHLPEHQQPVRHRHRRDPPKGLGLPKGHVFGTGTGLDSARLIAHLAETTGVDHKSITAYMIGEHGNAQFAPWSVVSFGANKLSELAEKDERFPLRPRRNGAGCHRGGPGPYSAARTAQSMRSLPPQPGSSVRFSMTRRSSCRSGAPAGGGIRREPDTFAVFRLSHRKRTAAKKWWSCR